MGKILLWLQERVKLWTKPATPVLIIDLISDLTRRRTDHSETASQATSVDQS